MKRVPSPESRSAPTATDRRSPGSQGRTESAETRRSKPISLPDLDRLIHERMRLGIVSALAAGESLTFNELKSLLGASDGNLSVHARKLEEAGYIICTKSFDRRMPRTAYSLAAEGRRALNRYLGHLEALIDHARGK